MLAGALHDEEECPTQHPSAGSPEEACIHAAEYLFVALLFIAGFVDRIKTVYVVGKPASKYLLVGGWTRLPDADV